MNWSTLGAEERRNVVLGAIVIVAGVLSVIDRWGAVVYLGILGGAFAVYLALQPQIAPSVKLPASKGILHLVAGALAAAGFVLAGLTYLSAMFSFGVFALIFDIGLVASLVLLWFCWQVYQAEQGTMGATSPSQAPATPAAPAPATPAAPPPGAPAGPPPAPPEA
jgi:hypothetical protein